MEYIDKYEESLQKTLRNVCEAMELTDHMLAESPDIDEKWHKMNLAYLGDAVKEFEKYPTVSLGWAMYLGMAVAHFWDTEWEAYADNDKIYEQLRDARGFDYMDEYVRETVLGMKGEEFDKCEENVRICAEKTLDTIRHEQIEPGSPIAFHVYNRSIKTLYKIGAAIELKRLGYKMQKQ